MVTTWTEVPFLEASVVVSSAEARLGGNWASSHFQTEGEQRSGIALRNVAAGAAVRRFCRRPNSRDRLVVMSQLDPMKPKSSPEPSVPPELATIVRAGVRAGREIAGSIATGGTVCSLYAQHRISVDIDFVLKDLRNRFEDVREHLLDVPGWRENRVRPPVLILGSMDGVEVGYRQLRRSTPIETKEIQTADGPLVVPTLEELVRIKAFLAYERNYTRDFVDFAELSAVLGENPTIAALSILDEKLGWEKQPLVLDEVMKALLLCKPRDFQTHGYETFRWLHPRLKGWHEVEAICKAVGEKLSVRKVLGEGE